MTFKINVKQITKFETYLTDGEKSPGTIAKYLRDVRTFFRFQEGRACVDKNDLMVYKQWLLKTRTARTVNSMLIALNSFLGFIGASRFRVKLFKTQHAAFRPAKKELTKNEYIRLVDTAIEQGKKRLSLLIQTIAATGIRVSEVKYITVEAARAGKTEILSKGKIRTILLPAKLCRRLLKYAQKGAIGSGEIFLTKNSKGLSRNQIWAEMKTLCEKAGVEQTKVFPHNLRHLFARCFYKVSHDLVKLADVLGHSSVDTTRLYLATTEVEHVRYLERLALLL